MRVLVELPQSPRRLARPFQLLLNAAAEMAAAKKAEVPLPFLYETNVRYQAEPQTGTGIEEFASPWMVLQRGWGDCDDLVIYRGAELVVRGLPCHARILRKVENNHYHTQLTRDFDELTEDPSLQRLGKPYVYLTNDLTVQPMANPP